AKSDRHIVLLCPSIDLFSSRYRSFEIVDYRPWKTSFTCTFDTLDERNKGRVEIGVAFGHHRDRCFTRKVCMLDRADAGSETATYAFVGVDVSHHVGPPSS